MENEAAIRLSIFLILFALLAWAEWLAPRRARCQPRATRWITNLASTIANTLTLRALALPLLAIGAALDASRNGWGLLNAVDWPVWLEVALAVLVLDLAIRAQRLVTHKIPVLWRLHPVHRADRDADVTTVTRFHPVEIALAMLLKIGIVYLLGPSAVAVILFEILLNCTAMFNHANIRLGPRLGPRPDAALGLVLVTPDMHRVHHSVHRGEHDSNCGLALSVWDRMFRTHVAQPRDGHDGMTTGLSWQDDRPSRLGWSLALPFRPE